MGKQVKSQWSFGELFPPEQVQKTFTVSELTGQIKRLLEKQIGEVRVSGEVSNLKIQSSGHIYFSLKDAGAQLNCVLFRGELDIDRALLSDGSNLVLKGQLTVYEARGVYQLRVTSVELQGVGALQAAFEKLKAKLKTEGLFAQERKRSIPRFCNAIGLVTSPTGAALRDVLHVVQRRNPSLRIVLAPCRVQGAGAAAEIAAAIHQLNEFHASPEEARTGHRLDCILITRGGGSLEDLWPFNEETVARAIFNSSLPVISAVGHEIDFTISDFVADLRAATPSAAAEILTEGMFAACQVLGERQSRLRQLTLQQLQRKGMNFAAATRQLLRMHPARAVEARGQRLDEACVGLIRCMQSALKQHRGSVRELGSRLGRVRPSAVLTRRRETLLRSTERMSELVAQQMRHHRQRLHAAESGLKLLGPDQVLARGYSITTDERGRLVKDITELQCGQNMHTRLRAGEILSKIQEMKKATEP